MNSDLKFYWALVKKRLPAMMFLLLLGAGIGIGLSLTLPPTYQANARLLVENAQIDPGLATQTVQTTAEKQLQIIEERLMTRANMIEVANKFDIFDDVRSMKPDDIFEEMDSMTRINVIGGDARRVTVMDISFEARDPQVAADVVNDFVTLVESESAKISEEEAKGTAQFFESEVERLSDVLAQKSETIVAFKEANSDALPADQDYRLERHTQLQERLSTLVRDRASRIEQRNRLAAVGAASGVQPVQLTPQQQELATLESQLASELSVLSENHPRVRRIRAQIAQLKTNMSPGGQTTNSDPLRSVLEVQLSDIESQIKFLDQDIASTEARLETIREAIERTPKVAGDLEALNLDYQNVQLQYNQAVSALAKAKVGESVEARGVGERISVTERAVPPTKPSGPKRKVIAGGGLLAGSALAAFFFVLTELLNRSIRRPTDLTRGLGVQPLATIPFIEREEVVQRRKILHNVLILLALLSVPLGLWALHTFYLPLEILADRMLDALGL